MSENVLVDEWYEDLEKSERKKVILRRLAELQQELEDLDISTSDLRKLFDIAGEARGLKAKLKELDNA